MVRYLARHEGLLVGISTGANVVAARKLAKQTDGAVIVTMMCDRADKYLSEHFWNDHD
jgi:cysteine synthase B